MFMPVTPRYEIYGMKFSDFDAMRRLSGPNLWFPGHDPAVLQRFPTQPADIAYLR
jgi:hypothetical protein